MSDLPQTFSGSCLCSAITWSFSGTPTYAFHCHCSLCRKAHGAAFGSYYQVPESNFRWTGSVATRLRYPSSLTVRRSFCGICGSVVPSRDQDDEVVFVPAGSHDHGPEISTHLFAGSKAPWHDIEDDLPQHYAGSVDVPSPDRSDPVMEKSSDRVCRGSCLCKRVTFEIREPFQVIHNCYCSRCRRARAAAFTTNGFTSAEGVQIFSGANHIREYKLPDAQYFTQAFCGTCGSGLPRMDTERNLTVVPLGALDDPPGQHPMDHIFVADRADWYEIFGSLPQFSDSPD